MSLSIHNNYMFAAQTPQLQEKKLCCFLEEMDKAEHNALGQDEAKVVNYGIKALGITGALGNVLAVCATVRNIFWHTSTHGLWMKIASDMLMIIVPSNILLVSAIYLAPSDEEKIQMIERVRIARLETKIEQIDKKLSQSLDLTEKQQLNFAKNYFSDKVREFSGGKVQVIIN